LSNQEVQSSQSRFTPILDAHSIALSRIILCGYRSKNLLNFTVTYIPASQSSVSPNQILLFISSCVSHAVYVAPTFPSIPLSKMQALRFQTRTMPAYYQFTISHHASSSHDWFSLVPSESEITDVYFITIYSRVTPNSDSTTLRRQ
jgi:hypothetical protein